MFSTRICRTTTVSILVLLTVSALGVISTSPVRAQQQSSENAGLKQSLHSFYLSLDQARAIALSQASPEFQSQTRGHNIRFNSIYLTFSGARDLSPDSIVVDSVNVVFTDYSNNAGLKNVVVTLDPSLAQVTNVETQDSFQAGPVPNCASPPPVPAQKGPSPQNFCDPPPPPPPPCVSSAAGTNIWAGYGLKTSCNGISYVYEARSQWSIPAVSEPWTTACQYYHCDLSIWPGLEDQLFGASYLAQLGSDSGVYCGAGFCGYYYSLWYEFWPDNSVNCAHRYIAAQPGDHIDADVWNEIINNGDYHNWDFLITDTPANGAAAWGCQVVMNKSYYLPQASAFIAERPHFCQGVGCFAANYDTRLPFFNSFTMTAFMNQRNPSQTVSGWTAQNNKWYTSISMNNQDPKTGLWYNNLYPSAFDASSTFTINYVQSTAT